MSKTIKRLFTLLCVCFVVMATCFTLSVNKVKVSADGGVFEMVDGASIRFADDEGIRFRVKMDSTVYGEIFNNDDVTLKILITSKSNFDNAKGDYMGISNKRIVEVDEGKIYNEGEYYFANGCLVDILEANRDVTLVAIAVKLTNDANPEYATIGAYGATGSMYDVLNQALLAKTDYVAGIAENFGWFGSENYPVIIDTAEKYDALANKFADKADVLQNLKYEIVDEVNKGTIENETFDQNVTSIYTVTFDPNNGGEVITRTFKDGETIVVPESPVKAGDKTYNYTFAGWGEVPETCTGSATYTAQYTESYVNYNVKVKSHDGSIELSSANFHYNDVYANPVELGYKYTVGNTDYEVVGFQSEIANVTESAEIKAIAQRCAPEGSAQGYINAYNDNAVEYPEKLAVDTYINVNAHTTLGNFNTSTGEKIMYREFQNKPRTHLWDNSDITIYYMPNNILKELCLPFYFAEITGDVDMNLRLYAGAGTTVLPLAFKDANGNTVDKADLEVGTWYTAVYTLTGATATIGQKYCLTAGAEESDIKFYFARPYFTFVDGVSADVKANFSSTFDKYTNSQDIAFKTGGGGTVSAYCDGETLVTVGKSNHQWNGRLFFSDSVWADYLTAQTAGGKVMSMDINFGDSVSLSGYLSGSSANLNTYRADTSYFRFYDADGKMIAYANLQANTWYRLDLDIDAIKTGIGEQTTSGTEPSIKFARESDGTLSIKNVRFIIAQDVAFKTGGGGTVSAYYDGDTLVTVGKSNHQWNGRLFFSDSVWADYLTAQTAGGKVMSMDINFGDSVSLSGYLSGSSANLNTYRANPTFFRFYGADGKMVAYANLQANTWYRLDLDIDAIKTGIGEQTTSGTEPNIKFARESDGTLSIKNVRFVDTYETGLIFKSAKEDAITFSYDGNDLVTEVHYCDYTATPFADSIFKDYLTAQATGGMVLRYQVKFTGSATINGYINSTTLAGVNNPRGNRAYFRYYDAQGVEVAYANLATDTWYTMVIDIDAIKGLGTVQENALNGNITGCSLRFGPNVEGQTISVKNVEFVAKANENPVA